MRLHALAGLPRSGSTLLANVLSQHPHIHVSGTSALSLAVEKVVDTLSTAPEVQSDLANVPGAYDGYLAALRGLCDGWYINRPEAHVVDKGRNWVQYRALLTQIYPGSALIVCVRDPRDVIASIERQHQNTALFNSPVARTIHESADLLMRQDGMVGGPIRFCEDLLRRNLPGVVYVRYESLAASPQTVVDRIYDTFGIPSYQHDFDDVQNVATDLDALYRGKYPHDGSGTVKPSSHTWRDVIDGDLAAKIAGVYPMFMHHFGYT